MTDLSALGISPATTEEWHEFFRQGKVFTARLNRPALKRRMRANTAVLVVIVIATALVIATTIAAAVFDFGRVMSYLLLAAFFVALGFLFLKFWWTRRRLRAGLSSSDEYLVVSTRGVRYAGQVDIPWSAVFGGFGFDSRADAAASPRRFVALVSRASGVASSEFILGVRHLRTLRDQTPRALWGVFEVIGNHGCIRIPIDSMVEEVRASIAALAVAGEVAGVRTCVSNDSATIYAWTMALAGSPTAFESALSKRP